MLVSTEYLFSSPCMSISPAILSVLMLAKHKFRLPHIFFNYTLNFEHLPLPGKKGSEFFDLPNSSGRTARIQHHLCMSVFA